MKRRRSKPTRPNTGGLLLPGTGRGAGPHKDRRNPTGKQQRKAFSSRQNRGIE